ncbi:nuclease-related domain-containing protein [Streptomyces sp. NPDC001876]|uniref:nuclease-related domain-containing protein n=1 Tax=Streptomyces sp. NPDC001876 TaxID=3154402 RepID=UPI003322AC1E
MDELEVKPWTRYGHDRLYVCVVGGEKVAWFDRKSGHFEALDPSYRDQALNVLAPYLVRPQSTPPTGLSTSSATPLSPADDLALNRPGAALRLRLEGSPSWLARLVLRLRGRSDESASWRKGLAGERVVGAELDRLVPHGWRVLHSIPLPSGADIDHLVIGPGGVFCLNTKNFSGARIWVGDEAVKVNGGPGRAYLRNSRHEARRASRVLSAACRFAVEVRPVLIFVSPGAITMASSSPDVQVIKEREVASFKQRGGVLRSSEIESVHAVARDRRTWLAA